MRPQPHEIQPDLDRRRRVVTEFRSATPVHQQVPDDFDEALDEISDVLDDAMRALARLSRSGNSAHDLVRSFGLLDSYVAKWTQLQPRPLRNKARTLGRSLVQLRAGLDDAVEALGAHDARSATSRRHWASADCCCRRELVRSPRDPRVRGTGNSPACGVLQLTRSASERGHRSIFSRGPR